MAYILKTKLANPKNYGAKRATSDIKYLVYHYTANDGDTDEGNGSYFNENVVYTSAHYFVDKDSVTQTVPDNYVGYSVGGNKYADCAKTGGGKFYGKCTNANSLSIEICDNTKNGTIYPDAATIANAIALGKKLMKKYNIPADRVIRHFDVNGKRCPAYWCGTAAKDKKWKTELWNKLTETTAATSGSTAKTVNYKVVVTADVLNVRKGPSTEYAIATSVKENEIYTIVGENNKWGKLKSGAGWISLAYASKILKTVQVTADSLNVREGGSTKYDIITALGKGVRVSVIAEKNGWGKIKLKDGTGWINLSYTKTVS